MVREPGEPFVIEEIDLDEPRANEVVVRVISSGICHTDLATRDGDYKVPLPCVLGHEGAGIVELVGSHCTTVHPGDHVVIGFNTCGKCPACLMRTPYCEDVMRIRLGLDRPDGSPTMRKGQEAVHGNFFGQSSFATHALCEEASLVKVRSDIPLDVLGPFACSVETGAGAIFTSLRCAPGSSLAVFGAGAVGMCAVMAGRVAGCTTIIAVDVKDNRLQLAQELGATHIINAAVTDPVQEIQRITKGGVNYSFESTGVTKVIRQAVDALRPLGVCGMVGQVPPGEEVSLDPWTILLGRTLRGIIQGDAIPQILIPQIVDLYLQDRFPIDRLIQYYPLEEINKAAAESEEGTVIKAVLRPNAS
ncbi:MAG: NAD(P)-dependent alcohol dehydrogenase [Lysobacterales bacterium]